MGKAASPGDGMNRQKIYKLRKSGKLPAAPKCKACGKQLKVGSGKGKAYALGLCYDCFKTSPEGRVDHRRANLPEQRRDGDEVWGVGYWARKPHETELTKCDRLRAAAGVAFNGRGKPTGPVFICWSDGRITEHYGLTAKTAVNMTPDHPSAVEAQVDDPSPEWFYEQVPREKQTWFQG